MNIARMREPLDSPRLADFVAALDPVNAVADAAPGFIWRLQSEGGDATSLRPYGDEPILVNMSVWETVEHLKEYVYRSAHIGVVRDRRGLERGAGFRVAHTGAVTSGFGVPGGRDLPQDAGRGSVRCINQRRYDRVNTTY